MQEEVTKLFHSLLGVVLSFLPVAVAVDVDVDDGRFFRVSK